MRTRNKREIDLKRAIGKGEEGKCKWARKDYTELVVLEKGLEMRCRNGGEINLKRLIRETGKGGKF